MSKTIISHPERCLACATCIVECAISHSTAQTIVGVLRAKKPSQPRIFVESVGDLAVPIQCLQCEAAPCLTVCPTDAIHRETDGGPVVLETDKCSGCRQCLLVCPYGVIDTSRHETAVVKCDQCVERAETGLDPACVATCPTHALTLEDIDVGEYERAVNIREQGERLPGSPKTMKISHDEFAALADERALPAFLQNAVTTFIIDQGRCKACGLCLKTCPVDGITGERKVPHVINEELCIRCGQCREHCPLDAVDTVIDSEMELVLCDRCGIPFTTLAELESARSRVSDEVAVDAICPLCRRSQTVQRLAETTKKQQSIGCSSAAK